jgi:N utilization substance protein B
VPEAPARRGSTRTKARKRALDILFEADLREQDTLGRLAEHTEQATPPVRPFTSELVSGVVAAQADLDDAIAAELPSGWSLQRMPRVDRNLARLALFELRQGETDVSVVISEYVGLAAELSTDESPGFLNGVLAALVAHRVGTAG